tara:strand:+ start:243 stop:4190 length:3948 start_codon:yes stop_codon:yes gene_type:complete
MSSQNNKKKASKTSKNKTVKLYDYNFQNIVDDNDDSDDSSGSENGKKKFADNKTLMIQMFGMDEEGKTYSIKVHDYKPYFYVKLNGDLTSNDLNDIIEHLHNSVGSKYYRNSLLPYPATKCVKRKKLYEFDAGQEYDFIKLTFKNVSAFNKFKGLWYTDDKDYRKRNMKKMYFKGFELNLYEAALPPLLRFFHDTNINPSGWVNLKNPEKNGFKETECDYEYNVSYKNISPSTKIANVPLKIMSFDIEASSSHGDFPVPIKDYRKLAEDIITYWTMHKSELVNKDIEDQKDIFKSLVNTAFEYDNVEDINKVYYKKKFKKPKKEYLNEILDYMLENDVADMISKPNNKALVEEYYEIKNKIPTHCLVNNIIYFLNHKVDVSDKVYILNKVLSPNHDKLYMMPELEGDKCTFIGSSFTKMGEKEPYLNNMIVLNTCDKMEDVDNQEVIVCKKEHTVLKKWAEMIRREKPDIIIGYNIFGFDWKFLLDRAKELGCTDELLKISKNKNEECRITNSCIKIASGTHDLQYVKIPGRVQLDVYNYFRREVSLPSYKLDNVASHYIGDMVKDHSWSKDTQKTKVKSKNMKGLKCGDYICFEIINYSSDMYKDGKKFQVKTLDEKEGYFEIDAELNFPEGKIRWCLAKDDVTPQDIFRLTNQGPKERAIVGKYCVQDCRLVQNLLTKIDILSGMIAQSEVCSVPLDFIIMRGQGIKLLSFIAKKCALVNTVMPVIRKSMDNTGYEGAICLTAKKGLWTRPVGVVDYSSLYPSSMISENISHDSKVWTKEYDLDGNMTKETGAKDEEGNFKYDNLPKYRYVDIEYDTYEYIRKHAKAAAKKVKTGYKICRFAQFPDDKRAIMPTVLVELLAARKKTRGYIKFKTVTLKSGDEYSGFLKEKDDIYVVTDDDGVKTEINKDDVVGIKDTYDIFMKGVFNSRQLAFKIVANSLYGQTGGKTSSFYDKDIAASTTATGRKLLMYACKIVDEVYNDTIVETSHGKVHCNAETVYGDTDSAFMCFNLKDLDGNDITGKKELELTIELSIKMGEMATKFLKAPHDLEYEKTFYPFLLLSKKRYVGMLYETDINKCKCKFMGIVLKRRDNAPIVKDVYGGIIDILMGSGDIMKSVEYTQRFLEDMLSEKFGLDKLIISKSLRGFYKNPQTIAHKVLADRMGKRDPGTKPSVGSRVPFVYIQKKGKVKLQGDRIESPAYIKKHKLKPDYGFYITNQIKKPILQIFSLLLEQIPVFKKKRELRRKLNSLRREEKSKIHDRLTIEEKAQINVKYDSKEMKIRNKYVEEIVFKKSINRSINMKNNQKTLGSFFGK